MTLPPHDHSTNPPTPDAGVRQAQIEDAEVVGEIQALVWQEAYDGVVPPEIHAAFAPASFAQAWRESLAAPPVGVHRLLLATEGDRVVGFVVIGPSQDPDTEPTTAEVDAIGVHPMARRHGHGSRLLNAAADLLREAGAEHLTIWPLASHDSLRAFLGGAGMDPDGAFRDRVVSPDGGTAREVRLVASLAAAPRESTEPGE